MAETLSKEMKDARAKLRSPSQNADAVVPSIRKGEDSMSSRPFSLIRLLGANARVIDADKAKVEYDLCSRFNKALDSTESMISGKTVGSFMYPVARSFLSPEAACHPVTSELLSSAAAGIASVDPDEVAWLAEKTGRVSKGYGARYQKTAMSYLTDTTGGSLVAPPEMGELIPLMRNKSALDRAGARQVPLPPNGKWVAPRVTGPTTGYWIGENTAITESNPTTGEISMQAKKLAVTCRVPNELFKYASAAADAMLRDDVTKTLSLGLDFAGLYGTGGGQPKGLIRYDDTNEVLFYDSSTPAPGGVATNGNTLLPQDGYRMASSIEDRNFDSDGSGFKWIMRPKMWGVIASRRADSVTANDSAGPFVQAITRLVGDAVGKEWCGYEVVKSAQVRNNQVKGTSGATLTEVFGGVWNELLMGLYGAVEFASNPMGEAAFQADQTIIRGILHADSCLRFPGAFTVYKELLIS